MQQCIIMKIRVRERREKEREKRELSNHMNLWERESARDCQIILNNQTREREITRLWFLTREAREDCSRLSRTRVCLQESCRAWEARVSVSRGCCTARWVGRPGICCHDPTRTCCVPGQVFPAFCRVNNSHIDILTKIYICLLDLLFPQGASQKNKHFQWKEYQEILFI